jgi:DNA-binding PadR family transcriptional regulator
MTSRRSIDAFLPLTHLAYHLLLTLAEAPAHGYALAQRVRERSGGAVDPGTGSFYSVVRALCDDKLIKEVASEPDADTRRRYYGVTPLGLEVLAAEARRLEALLDDTRRLRLVRAAPGARK